MQVYLVTRAPVSGWPTTIKILSSRKKAEAFVATQPSTFVRDVVIHIEPGQEFPKETARWRYEIIRWEVE